MSLLSLRGVGKIYVSEGSVAVGLRGVDLDLDIGEFVAVTGKSGSGKTTLLNMLSGMDTYEEGEIYIDGEPTSHYEQSDWEVYRQKYISFIFQDYNIIDSFTVLQNVELALSYVDSPKERRAKALELIERVGLTGFKNHKGSKLSGGQKQRTVIARALAKDSPIILADEPTGNLDAKTSAEIIALLAEISKNKLVVVVTHSAEELKQYATREIRIFDGSIEYDMPLRAKEVLAPPVFNERKLKQRTLRRGFELGVYRFRSMPKLSFFMCMLMILASLGTFFATLMTDFSGSESTSAFIDRQGRVVLTRQDGEVFEKGELEALAEKIGAVDFSRYDYFYDTALPLSGTYLTGDSKLRTVSARLIPYEDTGEFRADTGRSPESADEVMLVLPIEWQKVYGKSLAEDLSITLCGALYKVSGIDYFIDNTKEARAIFTEEGFEACSEYCFLNGYSFGNISITDDSYYGTLINTLKVDGTLEGNDAYIVMSDYRILESVKDNLDGLSLTVTWTKRTPGGAYQEKHDYPLKDLNFLPERFNAISSSDTAGSAQGARVSYVDSESVTVSPQFYSELRISPQTHRAILENLLYPNYVQASLFFKNDRAASRAIETLRDDGYFALATSHSFTTRGETLLIMFLQIINVGIWLVMLLFLSLFLYICSARAIVAKRGDIAILRSMGIENRIIKVSMYAQTGISMIPSLIVLAIVAFVIYTSPDLNPMFRFLHAGQYIMIILGMSFINFYISRRYNKKMFKESVRKTLRGGAKE